nr:hypothetical protein [Bacteroidota bacterium]
MQTDVERHDYTVTELTQLEVPCSGTAVSCKNGNDGSNHVSQQQAAQQRAHLWSNGVTTASNSK